MKHLLFANCSECDYNSHYNRTVFFIESTKCCSIWFNLTRWERTKKHAYVCGWKWWLISPYFGLTGCDCIQWWFEKDAQKCVLLKISNDFLIRVSVLFRLYLFSHGNKWKTSALHFLPHKWFCRRKYYGFYVHNRIYGDLIVRTVRASRSLLVLKAMLRTFIVYMNPELSLSPRWHLKNGHRSRY